jgi:CRISPR-associated protein Cmr3
MHSIVHWRAEDHAISWQCPALVKRTLDKSTRIRLVLATPAIFSPGWKPAWLNQRLEGTPPGSRVLVRLVGVANYRWKAVSGWSLARVNGRGELDAAGKPGPKAIRRMVPAGSTYFFELVSGDPASLADTWLQSVSDDPQDRLDGFGLALWGTW